MSGCRGHPMQCRDGARGWRVAAQLSYAEFERLVGGFDLQPRWVAALPEWRILREECGCAADHS